MPLDFIRCNHRWLISRKNDMISYQMIPRKNLIRSFHLYMDAACVHAYASLVPIMKFFF